MEKILHLIKECYAFVSDNFFTLVIGILFIIAYAYIMCVFNIMFN